MSFEEELLLQTVEAKKAMIVINEMASRWANREDSNADDMSDAIHLIANQYEDCIFEPLDGVDSD